MPSAGGSATISGILYQILGTVHWAASIQLRAQPAADDLSEAQLIIEPAGGGGDIQVDSPKCRIVEQWKAKSDRGTWSMRELVDEVFPDLYRAVDFLHPAPHSVYRFVTEGRRGRWIEAQQLFSDLRSQPTPHDPIAVLDDTTERRFFPSENHTGRGFFLEIVKSLRAHNDIRQDDIESTYHKLWQLLCRFEIQERRTAESVNREIDHFLREFADYPGQTESKRRELCGLVLELAAQGDVRTTPQEFLKQARLDAVPFTQWARIHERSNIYFKRRAEIEWNYREEMDVRPPIWWPLNKPILVLTGDSGQGKTWQLAALALEVFRNDGVPVAISATGDADKDLSLAAREYWQHLLCHPNELSLERIAEVRRDASCGSTPFVTVFVDDVLSAQEAQQLARRGWEHFGGRLAISTLPPIARSLKQRFETRLEVIDVRDFSVSELRDYLDRNHREWGALPTDLRQTLRRPLLARLFCEISADATWRPTNEYELFERCWLRIRDARSQPDYPHDLEGMRGLAGAILDDSTVYPWPERTLTRVGVTSEMQRRLEAVGWLRRLEDCRVEASHDRLLNWAVAETLVSRRQSNSISTADLGAIITELFGTHTTHAGRYLGYVPMDVLWQIGDPNRGLAGELPELLASLEQAPALGHHPDSLYEESLPTLGERILDAMVDRLRATSGREFNPYPKLVAYAITQIGKNGRELATTRGLRLLEDDVPAVRDAGMRVLAAAPHPDALDKLWELHQKNVEQYENRSGEGYWVPYELSFSALRACVRLDPSWLRRTIESAISPKEPVSELAYLVAGLEGQSGRTIWRESKETLFKKVPSAKQRCLARCIGQHADEEEIPRLEAWLDQPVDLVAPTALNALTRMAPLRAIAGLARLRPMDRYTTRHWWLDELLLRCPNETREAIRFLMSSTSSTPPEVALVYQGEADSMDAETLDVLLDDLEQRGASYLENAASPAAAGFEHLLGIIGTASRLQLLERFETRAGTQLEVTLTRITRSLVKDAKGFVDHKLKEILPLLLKINGEGITETVNVNLSSNNVYNRLFGIEWALVRPDRTTRQLLCEIAASDDMDTDKYPWAQSRATVALAALGETQGVVACILKFGLVLPDLADVRHSQPPMTDTDLKDAFVALSDSNAESRVRGLRALSISGRPDLAIEARNALRQADPESDLALVAVHAIGSLRDEHPDVVDLVSPQLSIVPHRHAAHTALLWNRSSSGLAVLEQSLRRTGIPLGDVQKLLALNLTRQPTTRRAAATVAWNAIQSTSLWYLDEDLLYCLEELDSQEVRDFIIEGAVADDGVFVRARSSLIRALARFDKDAAFKAGASGLSHSKHDRERLPHTLVEIEQDRAIPVLCRAATSEQSSIVMWAIARAMRHARSSTSTRVALLEMLESGDDAQRRCGAGICGWQGTDSFAHELRALALDDSVEKVRVAAAAALKRQKKEGDVHDLLNALRDASSSRRWSIVESILNLGDPFLLASRDDPLWIGRSLSTDATYLWQHIKKRLNERIKELKKEAEKLDKDK